MNIFTNLLFLQGHLADPHMFDEDDERYSRGYGNRAASEQFFAPLGHARSADERAEARTEASPALGGCA